MQGNIINRIMESSQQAQPVVGMGVTKCMWSDRKPYTVIEVVNHRKILVQEDNAIRTDNHGMSESQSYSYERDPSGSVSTLTLRKNGRWIEMGDAADSMGWLVGVRQRYYDYSH